MDEMFSPGNDDVLAPVLDPDVSIGILNGEVSGVEPTAGKCFLRGRCVLEVAFHCDVAAKHDFTDGVAIRRNGAHGERVDDRCSLLQVIADALSTVQPSAFGNVRLVPAFVLRAYGRGTVHLGQPVDMSQIETEALHALDHRSRGRRTSHHGLDAARQIVLEFLGAFINRL